MFCRSDVFTLYNDTLCKQYTRLTCSRPADCPDHSLWNVRAARNRAQGGYFCPFFLRTAGKMHTFPTAPWPAAAPTTSPAPPAAKTHHLPGTGS